MSDKRIKELEAALSFAEQKYTGACAELAEKEERWIQEREAWIEQKAIAVQAQLDRDAAQSALAEAREDSERYRYVRDVAFQYANVSLSGNDDDGTAFVIFEPKLYLPDLPGELRYEEEDWDSDKIDAAIDAARGKK